MNTLNKYIDHTNLNQSATKQDIVKLCNEAKENSFATVCINPSWVPLCKKELSGSDIKITTVVGFPLGATTTKSKVLEAKEAIDNGADEIDMVINVGKLLEQDYDYIYNEIKAIKQAIGDKILKVILETCLLNKNQITQATKLAINANANFVKTSTGFSKHGATPEAIKIMAEASEGKIKIKASGGIRTQEDCQMYIDMGVERIGTSSAINY